MSSICAAAVRFHSPRQSRVAANLLPAIGEVLGERRPQEIHERSGEEAEVEDARDHVEDAVLVGLFFFAGFFRGGRRLGLGGAGRCGDDASAIIAARRSLRGVSQAAGRAAVGTWRITMS